MIKIQVWDIGSNKHKVTSLVVGDMIANMPFGIGTFNIYQFQLRMKVPIEQVVQFRVVQQPKRTFGVGRYGFQLDLQSCLI